MGCKIGDLVVVKSGLIPERRYGDNTFIHSMKREEGDIGIIVETVGSKGHKVESIYNGRYWGWLWTEEMLNKVKVNRKRW